ncbi:MAG: cupin domain-containing protein [Clostridiales bacterium]|nr:cupin domain-containing protein [Clostridiales bacterium]
MIKRKSEMVDEVRENMKGGQGSAIVTEVMKKGEYKGNARLVATITLNQNCSIGEHLHEGEEEIFYILEGEAEYNDNGNIVTLKQGDSCICVGGQKHSVANKNKEILKLFAVILTY